jgi:hypothetical protein
LASTKTAKLIVIALTVAALTLAATTLAAINVNRDVISSGNVTTTPNINVYSDIACTQNLTTIDWGSIEAGSSANQTIYVKNTGTGLLTLSLATSDWNPTEASSYLTINWNKAGTHLSAGESTSAILTLKVASNITGITEFRNTITIRGSA